MFKFWSLLQSKYVNNVCKLLELRHWTPLDPRPLGYRPPNKNSCRPTALISCLQFSLTTALRSKRKSRPLLEDQHRPIGWCEIGLVRKPKSQTHRWKIFSYYDNKVCNADCTALRVWNVTRASFAVESTSLHSNYTWTGSSPSTVLGTRKLETLGYPMLKTASVCVFSFWHNTILTQHAMTDRQTDGRVDGQTDGRIWRSMIYSACGAL